MKYRILCPLIAVSLLLPFSGATASEGVSDENEAIERKLDEIVIPAVSFSNLPLIQAMQSLSDIAEEYDESEDPPHGITIVVRNPRTRAFPPVNLSARGMNLRGILRHATQEAGYRFKVEDGAVVVYEFDGRFNLDFPGGTIRELIDAIEEQSGQKPNVALRSSAERRYFPPLQLQSVDVDQVMRIAMTTAVDEYPEFAWTWAQQNNVWTIAAEPREELQTQVFSLLPLEANFSLDDITTAIEIAWELEGLASEDVTVRVHEETGLLYIRGGPATLRTAELVLNVLGTQGRWISDRARRETETQTAAERRTQEQERIQRAAEELRQRRAIRQQQQSN